MGEGQPRERRRAQIDETSTVLIGVMTGRMLQRLPPRRIVCHKPMLRPRPGGLDDTCGVLEKCHEAIEEQLARAFQKVALAG